jgi:hypothetical protein
MLLMFVSHKKLAADTEALELVSCILKVFNF